VRVVLHACCGPCLLEPYDALSKDHSVLVVYANANIHPLEEYERRRDTLLEYAHGRGIAVEEHSYRPDAWAEAVEGLESDPARRCLACFRLRLGMAAERAAELGYDAVATTLTVSPYQKPAAIREAGEAACADAGVAYLVTDFRERYPDAVRRSRELGMYRQDFCGCRYSKDEATQASARRKSERAAKRRAGPEV
jgi:predicted adenine nucleotide alpha hydrolase (AANH) superfamily ATPase